MGILGDIGKIGINTLATPFEAAIGQNLYDPEISGAFGKSIIKGQDAVGQIGAGLAPLALNAVPGLGPIGAMAIGAGRSMIPQVNQDMQWDPNSAAAKIGQVGSLIGSAAMAMPGEGAGSMGSGANSFGTGAGTAGSIDTNFQQGLTGSTGMGGFGQNLNPMGSSQSYLMEDGGYLRDMMGQGVPTYAGGQLAEFNGPSHAEGGIPFNGSAEIEKKETVDLGEKYVYSDKLMIPGSKDKTFAKESKKFKDNDLDDSITKNTNKLMLARLKEQQEGMKKEEAQKEMIKLQKKSDSFMKEYGGYIDNYADSGMYANGGNLNNNFTVNNPEMVNNAASLNPATSSGVAPQYNADYFKNINKDQVALMFQGYTDSTGGTVTDETSINSLHNTYKDNPQAFFNAANQFVPGANFQQSGDDWTNQGPQNTLKTAQVAQTANPQFRMQDGKMQQLRTGRNTGAEQWQASNPNMAARYAQSQGMSDLGLKELMTQYNANPQSFMNQMNVTPPLEAGATPVFMHGGYLPDGNVRAGVSYGGRSSYGSTGVKYGGGAATYANGGFMLNNQALASLPQNQMGFMQEMDPGQGAMNIGDNYIQAPQFTAQGFSQGDNYVNDQSAMQQPQGQGNQFNTNSLLMAAPALGALAQGFRPIDKYTPQFNPEYNKAINIMEGRRYNNRPEIDAARRAQSTAYNQGRESAGGSSALELSNIHGAQVTGNRAVSAAVARKQNIDNQYKTQEAQLRTSLGSEKSSQKARAQEMDMRAEAARAAYTEKALDYAGLFGQLGQQNATTADLTDLLYGDLVKGRLGQVSRKKRIRKNKK